MASPYADPLGEAMDAWESFITEYNKAVLLALRTGGTVPQPPVLNIEQTAGAELVYFNDQGIEDYAEEALKNLEMRAARNEKNKVFLRNAARWRAAATLIRDARRTR